MTTTTDKLLALAEGYEEKARSLRLAVEELTGHQTEKAQGRINGVLQAAVALRQSQRTGAGMPAEKPAAYHSLEAMQALVRAVLREARGPLSRREVERALAARGVSRSGSHVLKLLADMPDVDRQGTRHQARYALARGKTRSTGRVARRSAGREKARVIVGLVQDAGHPLTITELVPLARAQGITNLTGIYNYVRAGYLKRVKQGGQPAYAFVAMPPEAGEAST
jgi:hypothetical protein